MSKIVIKKHLLMCTSVLGLSTSMLMSQNVISPLSSEGSNKDVEVHLTAEEQNQAEAGTYNTMDNVPLENRDVEIHITAEEQNQVEQEKMLNTGNF
ncbi:hypothetical protein [Priestia filamentosa]|uniref:hypothetical protein n=1 Tax=Priestia filamentosa TaxID=1402861 RepID=UPI000C1FAEEA|nr:hypothetical protein [Priestia filamentosa]